SEALLATRRTQTHVCSPRLSCRLLARLARGCHEAIQGGLEGKTMAGPPPALPWLSPPPSPAFWATTYPPGPAHQIHAGEFGPCPIVSVIIEPTQARSLKLGVDVFAGCVSRRIADLEVDQSDIERRDRPRPNDARVIVRGLDDGAHQA